MRRLLGIETSCDETGVALVEDGKVVHANVATQMEHSKWGGVVPEIASRLHQKVLANMVRETMDEAGWTYSQLDAVAATNGPGLIGALLVGVSYAKGLCAALNIPFVGVNHLEGHLWAAEAAGEKIELPAIALLVSGGHTELIRIDGFGKYTFLGGTLDDAAGEAFDKVGGLLGIAYPAGAELSKLALKGDPNRFNLPVPQTQAFEFSFSGLKTAALRLIDQIKKDNLKNWEADFAASFQYAAVTQLIVRVDRAFENEWYKSLVLAGGVAANSELRKRAAGIAKRHNVKLLIPPIEWCTDNGAMIGWIGARKLEEFGPDSLSLEANPNLQLIEERGNGENLRGSLNTSQHKRNKKK